MKDSAEQKAKKHLNRLIDLFFAPQCCVCGDRAADSTLPFCKRCIKDFQVSLVKDCPECGCTRKSCSCEKSGNTVFLFYYDTPDEKRVILNLKQNPDKRTARFLGRLLAEKVKSEKSAGFDCVAYVPRSPRNVRTHGGDQAKLIAAGVAKGLETPLKPLLVRKEKRGSDQKLLDAVERRKNVKNTFFPSEEAANYRRVLLIDDVTTTGSTIDECADILREAGVKQVVKAVLARTP